MFFFSILFSITNVRIHSATHRQCLEDQKTLLLELRSELIFDSSFSVKLTRWNGNEQTAVDCCAWHGVGCDAAGRVISLQLDDEAISGGLNDSSSLFRLSHLEKLNLAFNNFDSAPIPRGVHRLTHLTHLNLSGAGFGGQVPLEVSLLTRLVSLDISQDPYHPEPWTLAFWDDDQPASLILAQWDLEIPNLKMLVQNLTWLSELYLDGVGISGAGREFCQTISSSLPHLKILSLINCKLSASLDPSLLHLHSLSVLYLDYNNLSSTIPLDFLANLSSLTALSLRGCSLGGSFPEMIWQVPTLQMLDLSDNEFLSGSTIPQFSLNKAFRHIYMSGCSFVGPIPSTFSNLTELIHLDLSFNSLTGLLPSFHMLKKLRTINLSFNTLMGSLTPSHFGGLANLTRLDLANNALSGTVPHYLFDLPSLELLVLSNNQFSGIPINISGTSNIVTLNLENNSLIGSIPLSVFALPSLELLLLSNNQFSGKVHEFSTSNITKLVRLDLSTNQLEGPIPHSFFQILSLSKLSLSHNLFKDFPSNVSYSLWGELQYLDISNNQIVGDIPAWLWEIETLEELNMCCNLWENLQKPYLFPTSLLRLELQSNQLQGELLPLPQNARYVDYSSNYFNKPIPPTFFGNVSPYIDFLSLANNSLSGAIPTSLCNISLQVLDLSFNNLTSITPCVVGENTKDLQLLNLRGNNIFGVIPNRFPTNCSLRTMDLSNNILGGKIPKSLQNCKDLEVMNVGFNNFDDSFPCMLSPSLHVLVLRSNKFHGELRCGKSWPKLQIVDISSNNFSGTLHQLNFSRWGGMMLHFKPNHVETNFLGENSFYHNEVALTDKGVVVKLVKIWPEFTSIDLSCNIFQGDIPDAIGDLTSLYLLNLSHNALTGTIPKSMGVLTELESLDLSFNQLRGRIPEELAGLTFLSILNVSYNELVGMIPTGPQFRTFEADSFEGNAGLCGFPLNTSCSGSDGDGNGLMAPKEEDELDEIEWEYVCAALGYVVGLGSIAWILLFWRRFRDGYFDRIEEAAERILERRRRHGRTSVGRRS